MPIPNNIPSTCIFYDFQNKDDTYTTYNADDMIPVNPPNSDEFDFKRFMSINSNNIKYMQLLKDYFNLTYCKEDYTEEQNNIISDAFRSGYIFTVMPKITKIKLRPQYVFVHKYCNNCFYLNNSLYSSTEEKVAPTTPTGLTS